MKPPTYIVGTLQTRAYAILRDNGYKVLTKYKITPSHWFMLGVIFDARDGIRQSEVAKAMNVKPPLITVMVRDLQKLNLIHSVKNQFDSRAKLLSVTAEGKKFIKVVEVELQKQFERLLSGLTEDELEVYHKVLTTIVSNSK